MRSRALKHGRLRLAGNRWQPRLQCNRLLSLHIFQPAAQTPASAPVPQDPGLPRAGALEMGVETTFVPFMRQLIHATQPSRRCALLPRTGTALKPHAPGRQRAGHGCLPRREAGPVSAGGRPQPSAGPSACSSGALKRVMYHHSGCPRGDLNTETGEISPDRGNHAIEVTPAERTHPGIPQGGNQPGTG